VNRPSTWQAALKAAGVPTMVYYPIPLSRQPAYAHFPSAPTPVSNRAFTAELARSLQRKAFLVTPEWALKPVLGERSLLLFGGQRALPKRLMAKGFRFRFTGLATALAHASED
jgi:NAD dependent epimerase/dehydratase family enzyme